MWDLLILTAMDESQKLGYAMELQTLSKGAFRDWAVIVDEPRTEKIGSGGSTFLCLRYLRGRFGDFSRKKILVLHSGGFSQRLPTASALGKAFLTFPNGRNMVEMKLDAYRTVEEKLSAGVVIASSDTLEHFDASFDLHIEDSAEVLLFGHYSTIEVGEAHGVYILKGDRTQRVLQKPSRAEMIHTGALVDDDHVITDSFFALCSASLLEALLRVADSYAGAPPSSLFDIEGLESNERSEICCYGDFLRALGDDPILDYVQETQNRHLRRWRTELKEVFRGRKTQTLVLPGVHTFFHFGTTQEFSEHLSPDSAFLNHFPMDTVRVVFSRTPEGQCQYCDLKASLEVGEDCFLSNLKAHTPLKVPNNTTLITIALKRGRYVTVAFETNSNLKESTDRWFGVQLERSTMLWETRLFKVEEDAEASLETTLRAIRTGVLPAEGLLSIKEALEAKDVEKMITWRRNMRNLVLGMTYLI
uniref:Fucokinase domain-containing protein n=1 Tax=Steinernema glaseri TaxID=37863 RepID=A0A1I8AHU0_9BILA